MFRFLAYCLVGAAIGVAWSRFQRGHGDSTPIHRWREFVEGRAHAGFPPGILVSIVLLCVFSLYWEAAARNSSETKSKESSRSRAIHLALITAGQLLLLFPVAGLRTRFIPDLTPIVAAGLVLELAFLTLAVWARRLLGRNWSAAVTIKVDHQLIRSGPYRFVRHPIYSALLGAYTSIALISGELHALLGLILVFAAYWRKIRLEEEYLGTVFGAAYSEYQAAVSAVIPGVW